MDFQSPMRISHYPRSFRLEGCGSLSQRIIDTFYHHSDRILLEDENIRLTGRECRQTMMNLKRSIELNVPSRGRVAVLCPNSVSQALAIFAILVSGRVPVILNHKTRPEDFKRYWNSLNVHGAVVSTHLDFDFPMNISVFRISPTGRLLSTYGDPSFLLNPFPHPETALILYTSGSQGEPKGVEIAARSLLYTVDTLIPMFGLSETTVSPMNLPLYHTMGLNTHFFPTFFAGGKCVFFHTKNKINYGRCFRNILESSGTFVSLITDILRLAFEEKRHDQLMPAAHVRVVQIAGGSINEEHLEMARELFPNAVIYKGYGLTEAIRISMISSRDPLFMNDNAGKVLPGQVVRIKHPSTGRVLPAGVIGEVYVQGPNVMIGYEDGHNPFDMDGFLGTGDLGFLTHDNYLVICGRKDSIFKTRGRRVSGVEIERVALEVPSIKEAKCMPVKSKRGLVPVLFVSTKDQMADSADSIQQSDRVDLETHLKKNLEPFKLPRDIVVLAGLPRTENGKVSQPGLMAVWNEITSSRSASIEVESERARSQQGAGI